MKKITDMKGVAELSGAIFFSIRTLFGAPKKSKGARHLIGAIFGIGLSLVPLIMVLQVTNGMIEGITRRYLEIGSYHMQIRNQVSFSEEELSFLVEKLSAIEDVRTVFPVTQSIGLVYSENGRTGVTIRALPENYSRIDRDAMDYLSIIGGDFNLSAPSSVLISEEVARNLSVSTGDRIRLLTARIMPGRRPVLRPSFFTVEGIFSTGYYELDSLSIYIEAQRGRTLFPDPANTFLAVKVNDPYENLDKIATRILSELPRGWYLYTWFELERPMYKSFQTTKNLLIFIMILIILVAGVNISSSMIMLVLEKEPEIAILKSTGVSPGQITLSFLSVGFFIGLSGTLAGIIAGLLAAVNINEILFILESGLNLGLSGIARLLSPAVVLKTEQFVLFDTAFYLEKIPVRINIEEILLIAGLSVFFSTASSWFPASRAGKIRPLEVLRKH